MESGSPGKLINMLMLSVSVPLCGNPATQAAREPPELGFYTLFMLLGGISLRPVLMLQPVFTQLLWISAIFILSASRS